jgi:hypothetical protein
LDNSLCIWDLASRKCLIEFKGHKQTIKGVIPLSLGRVLSWAWDGTVLVWDTTTGECFVKKEFDKFTSTPIKLEDNRVLLWGNDNVLRILDLETGEYSIEFKKLHGIIHGAEQLKNGSIMSWGDVSGLHVWDAATGRLITDIKSDGWTVWKAVELQSGRVLTWGNETLRLWDLANKKLCASYDNTSSIVEIVTRNPEFPFWALLGSRELKRVSCNPAKATERIYAK